MSKMYFLPLRPAFDSAGITVPGSQHYFTLAGTNTPSAPFTDATLATHHENPLVSNGIGYLPPVYLDPDISYRVRIYAEDAEVGVDTPLEEYDPYVPAVANADIYSELADVGGAALIGSSGGGTVQDGIFTKGRTTAIAGSKAKINSLRDDATYPLEDVGAFWTGAMEISHGIAATFTAGDIAALNPGFAFFAIANDDNSGGEVVGLGGVGMIRSAGGTAFAGNFIVGSEAIANAKPFGVEIDVELHSGATSISSNGRALSIVAFNHDYPFPAIHIGKNGSASFANGIILEGVISTGTCLALGSAGLADSLINSSAGTFTTAAFVMGQGATRGIKWFTSGGLGRGGLYFDGTNVRVVLPTGAGAGISFRDAADATSLVSITDTGTGGSIETVGVNGQYLVNGTKVVGARKTGWAVDTGTAKRTANATYAPGTTLTYSATYVQAEQTAMATRMAAVEAALRDATQTIKALKDDMHGAAGHGLIGT